MKLKIFKSVGPLVLALILVALMIFLPFNLGKKYSRQQLDEFAQNPSDTKSFIGYSIKNQAFSQPDFLPILGSSELEKVNAFHPSVYFAKYNHGFTPFLAGQPGTTSLTQYFYVNSAAEQLKNRKMVFIISPQWFTKQGVSEVAMSNFVSNGSLYQWLAAANPKDLNTQDMAKRLLSFKAFPANATLKSALKTLADGKAIAPWNMLQIKASDQLWMREDQLFSGFDLQKSSPNLLEHYGKNLPLKANANKLGALALFEGQKAADNNSFNINNGVWQKNLKPVFKKRAGTMKNVTYQFSPEYADFQQLLNLFAENHDQVLFVIQPVNGEWYKYAGLSEATLQNFATKIKTQLSTQGFNQVADFTSDYQTPYFIGDTIHFGTRGWLATDQAISSFMKTPLKTDYHMNNSYFLSKDWQNQK